MRWAAGCHFLLIAVAAPATIGQEPEWPAGRWNPYGELPIRFHIDATNLSSATSKYADEARAAFAYWREGGNGALSWQPDFLEVARAEDAHVRAWFVDAETVECHAGAIGAGCGGYGSEGYQGVAYSVMKRARGEGEFTLGELYLPYSAVLDVMKHEVGHALGLDHSATPGDVMHSAGDALRVYDPTPGGWLPQIVEDRPMLSFAMAWVAIGAFAIGARSWRRRRARPPF